MEIKGSWTGWDTVWHVLLWLPCGNWWPSYTEQPWIELIAICIISGESASNSAEIERSKSPEQLWTGWMMGPPPHQTLNLFITANTSFVCNLRKMEWFPLFNERLCHRKPFIRLFCREHELTPMLTPPKQAAEWWERGSLRGWVWLLCSYLVTIELMGWWKQ